MPHINKLNKNKFYLLKILIVVCLTFSSVITVNAINASAFAACPPPRCCCEISCRIHVSACNSACTCQSGRETGDTIDHSAAELENHERWIIHNLWEAHVLPSMMLMAQQMSVTAMQQVQIIGTFFDAKHQLESQRLLQDLQAQAHKQYHPSTGMCRFGTSTRSLALSDRNVEMSQIALAARNTNRILMNSGTVGTGGARDDSRSRLAQFIETYCNPSDYGNALDLLCAETETARRNKDVNFLHAMHGEDTLLVNFADAIETEEEEDILALSANLYGSRLLPVINERHTADEEGNIVISGATVYMDTRALAAKRSVAFNSFAAQAGMKSEGGPSVTPYMTELLEEIGIPEDGIETMLKGAPSYNTQMEILTKKIYQWPNFYSDLYDKPVNIDRKDTSIQAIALMQKRDMYRSQLRSEANMAVWLELMVEDLQDYHANEAVKMKNDTNILTNLGL